MGAELEIKDLHVSVEDQGLLKGVTLGLRRLQRLNLLVDVGERPR